MGTGFFTLTLVAGVYIGAHAGSAVVRVAGWSLPVVGALVAFRYWTMRIEVRPLGITVIQWPVRRFIPWVDVLGFEVGPGSDISGSSRCIHVLLRDGDRVKSYAVQRSRDDAPDLVSGLDVLRAALVEHSP